MPGSLVNGLLLGVRPGAALHGLSGPDRLHDLLTTLGLLRMTRLPQGATNSVAQLV